MTPVPDESFCYLTTRGQVTGTPHEIEIWFAGRDDTIYLLSGGGERADWVKNMRADPTVTVRIGGLRYNGRARVVGDGEEEQWARTAPVGEVFGQLRRRSHQLEPSLTADRDRSRFA